MRTIYLFLFCFLCLGFVALAQDEPDPDEEPDCEPEKPFLEPLCMEKKSIIIATTNNNFAIQRYNINVDIIDSKGEKFKFDNSHVHKQDGRLRIQYEEYTGEILTSNLHLRGTWRFFVHSIASISDQPEILFQNFTRNKNTFTSKKSRRNRTDSRETYQNAAKKQYELLVNNHRRANYSVTVNYWKEFFIKDILEKFKLMKEYLRNDLSFSRKIFSERRGFFNSSWFYRSVLY